MERFVCEDPQPEIPWGMIARDALIAIVLMVLIVVGGVVASVNWL